MSSSGRFRFFAIVATTLFAMSLSAQRYQGRDHHVFHRPPPAQTKHQPALPSASVPRAGTSTTHIASATQGQNVNFSAPANTAPRPPKPATIDSDRVH